MTLDLGALESDISDETYRYALMLKTAFLALLLAIWAGAATADRLTVFAAASLKTVLEEIAADFTERTGHDVTLSVAGSAVLARQILAGAPADMFVSANPAWMDAVADDLVPNTRRDLLGNHLVLIAPAPSDPVALDAAAFRSRLEAGPLALALVDSIPAGIYGKAALEAHDLWAQVADQTAQTDNVRAALALVALGEAPLGIVYATDAKADPRVSVVARFDPASHPPIRYPVAALTDSEATRAFLAFLSTADATFAAHGFEVLP